MNVLGIDPDTKATGLGVVRDGIACHGRSIRCERLRAKIEERRSDMINRLAAALAELRTTQPECQALDLIVIEGQRYRPGSKVRAQDLIHLGHIAGALLGICRTLWPEVEILFPEPSEWKGSVPKAVFTKRILRDLRLELQELGLCYQACKIAGPLRLPGTVGLSKANASHVIDGLGLAKWGLSVRAERSRKAAARERRAARAARKG